MHRPHAVERGDAVDQPLGIIEPVDADGELLAMQAAAQPRHVGMRRRLGRGCRELVGIDADRKHRQTRAAMARLHDAIPHLQAKVSSNAGAEIVPIVLGLETDEIIGQHRGHEIAVIRYAVDDAARGPRRMQEEADRALHAQRAQFRAEREKMIILNPEQGLRLLKPQQGTRDERIHLAI